jgi:hypothetical protein
LSHVSLDRFAGQIDLNPLAIPTFLLLALQHLFQYVLGLYSDSRPDLQRAISARMSLLGNRIGSEFESEIRTCLGSLHGSQERSIANAAHHYAETAVSWF